MQTSYHKVAIKSLNNYVLLTPCLGTAIHSLKSTANAPSFPSSQASGPSAASASPPSSASPHLAKTFGMVADLGFFTRDATSSSSGNRILLHSSTYHLENVPVPSPAMSTAIDAKFMRGRHATAGLIAAPPTPPTTPLHTGSSTHSRDEEDQLGEATPTKRRKLRSSSDSSSLRPSPTLDKSQENERAGANPSTLSSPSSSSSATSTRDASVASSSTRTPQPSLSGRLDLVYFARQEQLRTVLNENISETGLSRRPRPFGTWFPTVMEHQSSEYSLPEEIAEARQMLTRKARRIGRAEQTW
jgi:hypothetical protein